MAFLGITFSVICRVETVANFVSVLSVVKSAVSDYGIIKANGKKHMLCSAVCACPLCYSSLNILIIGVVRHIILRKGRRIKIYPYFFYTFPIIRHNMPNG